MAPALGFAVSLSAPLILLFCMVCGLGLAFPYLVLAANPGWMRKLPRPGPWMETFKQFMGFPLMATVVWLLYVLGSQAGAEGVVWTLAFLLVLGVAGWMIGLGQDLRAGPARRRALPAAALVLAIAGFYAFPMRYLAAFETRNVQVAATDDTPFVQGGTIWQPFSVERVEQLVESGRLVFVDFTADWCLQCKVNEAGALASERVREAFRKYNVATVRADYTLRNDAIGAVLGQLGRSGVPVYVVFPAANPAQYIVLPSALTPGIVETALAEAAGREVATGN
jgi:thiol:disulfide interchange protein DsbD